MLLAHITSAASYFASPEQARALSPRLAVSNKRALLSCNHHTTPRGALGKRGRAKGRQVRREIEAHLPLFSSTLRISDTLPSCGDNQRSLSLLPSSRHLFPEKESHTKNQRAETRRQTNAGCLSSLVQAVQNAALKGRCPPHAPRACLWRLSLSLSPWIMLPLRLKRFGPIPLARVNTSRSSSSYLRAATTTMVAKTNQTLRSAGGHPFLRSSLSLFGPTATHHLQYKENTRR